jgi:hypothetical protein
METYNPKLVSYLEFVSVSNDNICRILESCEAIPLRIFSAILKRVTNTRNTRGFIILSYKNVSIFGTIL